jgi:hypothetical protein
MADVSRGYHSPDPLIHPPTHTHRHGLSVRRGAACMSHAHLHHVAIVCRLCDLAKDDRNGFTQI